VIELYVFFGTNFLHIGHKPTIPPRQ